MSLPNRVRIVGFDFDVVTEDSDDFTREYMGQLEPARLRIRVGAHLGPLQQRETLLHEVLHGVDMAVGADLTEQQISTISRGLFAVIRDNPDFATFLTTD